MAFPLFAAIFRDVDVYLLGNWIKEAKEKAEFNEDGLWAVTFTRNCGRRGSIQMRADNVEPGMRITYRDRTGWIVFRKFAPDRNARSGYKETTTVHPPEPDGPLARKARGPRCFRCHDTGRLVASNNPCSCGSGEFFRKLG